jgi:LacI family transcriptional regulator
MAFPHKSQKIAATIEKWFAEKRFRPGDRFPSDQKLARQFGVNHVTVRLALKRFVEAGLLDRRVGAGTIVRAPESGAGAGPGVGLANAVGLAIPEAAHGFYADILRAVEQTLLGAGRPLLLGYSWEMGQREQQVIDAWLSQNVRHMIVAATVADPAFYKALVRKGVRLVLLDRRVPGVDAPSVTTRDHEGVEALVKLLVDQGHRRIVHLAGPANIWTAEQRRKSFVEAMKGAGLSVGPRSVVQGGYFIDDGHRAVITMLHEQGPPEAIFAANDMAAVGAIRALEERGLSVPGDVSVVGYGDVLDLSRNFGLTTVRQFPEQMALQAVQLLLAPKDPGAEGSVEIRPELVIRTSTAPRGD